MSLLLLKPFLGSQMCYPNVAYVMHGQFELPLDLALPALPLFPTPLIYPDQPLGSLGTFPGIFFSSLFALFILTHPLHLNASTTSSEE